jgi:hypothetical protein
MVVVYVLLVFNFFLSGTMWSFFSEITACSFGWWLMLVCSERKVLLTGAGG